MDYLANLDDFTTPKDILLEQGFKWTQNVDEKFAKCTGKYSSTSTYNRTSTGIAYFWEYEEGEYQEVYGTYAVLSTLSGYTPYQGATDRRSSMYVYLDTPDMYINTAKALNGKFYPDTLGIFYARGRAGQAVNFDKSKGTAINIASMDFVPVDYYNGTIIFENANMWFGIIINEPNTDNVGIFRKVGPKFIMKGDFRVPSPTVTGHNNVGVLIGTTEGTDGYVTMENITMYGNVKVSGNNNVGAYIGNLATPYCIRYPQLIPNKLHISISGAQNVGALIGYCQSTIGSEGGIDGKTGQPFPGTSTAMKVEDVNITAKSGDVKTNIVGFMDGHVGSIASGVLDDNKKDMHGNGGWFTTIKNLNVDGTAATYDANTGVRK